MEVNDSLRMHLEVFPVLSETTVTLKRSISRDIWSQYCCSRLFEIFSDHKPLEGMFSEHKPISFSATARLQRWAIILSAYDYICKYKRGREHANVDGLSRLPLLIGGKE